MSIIISGADLTIEKVVDVARNKVNVSLDSEAIKRIIKCRDMLWR